jgi:deoxycytidylate deaminase
MDALDVAARILSETKATDVFNRHACRMLNVALEVSSWSSSPAGRQHGCVLAVDGKYVVATGYNGPPRGEGKCECEGKTKVWCAKNCKAIHAEVNAICNAAYVGARVRDCWAFATKKPCDGCRGALKNTGIHGVVWLVPIEPGKELEFDKEVF